MDRYGGIITRIARHFQVNLARCTRVGRTESFLVETLYNQKLVLQGERGVEYLDGLRPSRVIRAAVAPALVEPNLEVPPAAEQPPARAPGRRRRTLLQYPAQQPPPPPPAGDPPVQRVDRLGRTSWDSHPASTGRSIFSSLWLDARVSY
ncbi:unnamed protein product [Linum trigynum]|uniref:Uncharacterized protein n=1 Tax=Linum trigynum TaxID=586398 RepID=A0AAV2CF27_9ROSI